VNEYWKNSNAAKDKNKMNMQISMVPLTVIGTKFDLFVKECEPV